MHHGAPPLSNGDLIEEFVADALDLTAGLFCAHWKRAVEILWREAVRQRRESVTQRERERAARRLKNLQRIVRKALADYHQIELERQPRLRGGLKTALPECGVWDGTQGGKPS